ncbi:HD-GYP domain-containing protein [Vibrio gazogenes]|uniref:HDIG domain-containing protein n=1 Tax=Vibrio gazogenes DSM 21264 = NBRC 103151 TaxID=1123492 RepID=A0A1M5B4W5_VIBGA|nr:HD-GYP domain-containing protein [Vibrio gazogenes]USP14139.1 HD-GYP domain-containing protein [Vibrio gazogenes]SHF37242.1 HDIG domain-containing protein [Vibrio gazogenes DSM 21264] [Vibrio gazogenes DSM 21264 = NBRC 103151]SJN58853.1 Cyclic di-GMP phosphodiesterase response regulator RpfG [Vibrio gazogenes]
MANIKITVDRLQPGLHIRLPVKWNDHPFLLNSFKIKNQDQINIIKHLGIQHVYLNPAQSDTQPLPPQTVESQGNDDQMVPEDESDIDDEAKKLWQEKESRIDKLKAYRRRVVRCEKEFERSLARIRSVTNKIRNRPQDAVEEATQLVADVVDELLAEDSVTLHLMNSKSEFEDIYFHSLNVSVIAMMIGRVKGFDVEKIRELAFAALFHDIGKIKVPAAIVRKQTPLTEPEKNYLKQHTRYGVDIANGIEGFPESAKRVISQHHEQMDGSGYPEGLKGDDIDELAQIIAVANAFDSLCHCNIVSEQKIPYAALSHLYKNCRDLYNFDNLSILVKFMGVYPPGTVVQLSNDMVGLVISINSNDLLYPSVLIYDPSVPRTEAPIVDLAEKELTIVNVILPAKLPDKVREYLNPRSRISYFFDSDEQ